MALVGLWGLTRLVKGLQFQECCFGGSSVPRDVLEGL